MLYSVQIYDGRNWVEKHRTRNWNDAHHYLIRLQDDGQLVRIVAVDWTQERWSFVK